MSNVVGPVCHIPAATQVAAPTTKGVAAVGAPPTDLPSALQAIHNLQQIIRNIVNQQVTNNTNNIGGSSSIKAPSPGSFTVQTVTMQTKRIYQNNDPTSSNYVDIEEVTSLVLADKNKNTWTYNNNG